MAQMLPILFRITLRVSPKIRLNKCSSPDMRLGFLHRVVPVDFGKVRGNAKFTLHKK